MYRPEFTSQPKLAEIVRNDRNVLKRPKILPEVERGVFWYRFAYRYEKFWPERNSINNNDPLPQIDLLVDLTAGHQLLSFMIRSGWMIRSREDLICHKPRAFLLQGHAIWVEECRTNVSKAHE